MSAKLLRSNEQLTIGAVERAHAAYWQRAFAELDPILVEMRAQRDRLAGEHPSIERIGTLSEKFPKDEEEAKYPTSPEELRAFRMADLRMRVFDRINDHITKLEQVKNIAGRGGNLAEAMQGLQHIGAELTYRLIRIEDELQEARTSRPAVFASIVLLGSGVVSAILSVAARLLVGQVVGLG